MTWAMIAINRPADSVDGEQGRVKTRGHRLSYPHFQKLPGNRVELKPDRLPKNYVDGEHGRVNTNKYTNKQKDTS